MFEIADKIELDDRNILLAHVIRVASRSFNLEAAVEHLCESLTSHCIKEELAKQIVTEIRKNLLNGKYEHIFEQDDFAQAINQDLEAISQNRHIYVMAKPSIPDSSSDKMQTNAKRIKELEDSNFGFGKLLTPKEGTAYLEIRGFENPKEIIEGKALIRDFAMDVVKKIVDSKLKALIIDLRNHGGGSVYMSELMLKESVSLRFPACFMQASR